MTSKPKLAFCAVFAYDLRSYGVSAPGITLEALLAQRAMVCDHYDALAWRLFLLMVPGPTLKVAAVGWGGGFIGNHSQLIACGPAAGGDRGDQHLLIDPTIGLVQMGYSYDWIASGKPCSSNSRREFYWRTGVMNGLHRRVITALEQGRYKPSDILYYCSSIERFCHPPNETAWMTPQADAWINTQKHVMSEAPETSIVLRGRSAFNGTPVARAFGQ